MLSLKSWIPFDVPIWIVLVVITIFLVHHYGTKRYTVWSACGVNGPRPWPFIGTALSMLAKGIKDHDYEQIQKYGKVVGLYEGQAPVLLLSDLDMVKQVLVKDFNNFMNRHSRPMFKGEENYMFRLLLVRLMGDHWKHVRTHITPTFSSGKLRQMVPQLKQCASILAQNLSKEAVKEKDTDFKSFSGAFTIDAIARTAFGLEVDSQNQPDSPFVYYAKQVVHGTVNGSKSRTMFLLLLPKLFEMLGLLKISQFSSDVTTFFREVFDRAISHRKESNQRRTDFMELMLKHKVEGQESDVTESLVNNGHIDWNRKGLTHEEILAQSVIFFVAGYETTASTMGFLGHCLAQNPTVQDKLLAEIDRVVKDEDEITYDMLQDMKYLEMCIQETLRLYPPGLRLMRSCSRDIKIGETEIRRGCLVAIPVYSIHRDPEHWPDPEAFIPERFTPMERAMRHPMAWLPFGAGPRNCIGMRLALLEVKIAMAFILSQMEFHTPKTTQAAVTFDKGILLSPRDPLMVSLKLRDNKRTAINPEHE